MSALIAVSGKIDEETRALMNHAIARFGTTESALVRMALKQFMPGFLATGIDLDRSEMSALASEAVQTVGSAKVRKALAALLDQTLPLPLESGGERKAV